MKKTAIITAIVSLCIAAGVWGVIPRAVESSAPAVRTLRAEVREYSGSVYAGGAMSYIGQSEITSSLPLVFEKILVRAGDTVHIGDEIAVVNRRSSAALLESMGQLQALAVPASELSAAMGAIPEVVVSDREGRVISTAPSGKAVQSGSSIATVARTEDLVLIAAIGEPDIAKIAEGQKARFTLTAYPDETFCGTVSGIGAAARDQYNGAVLETVVDVMITPDEQDARLLPGLSAEAEILPEEPREICVVAYSAIGQDDRGEYVYVYEGGKAVRRSIETGAEFADGTEVISGVTLDDVIFADPEGITEKHHIRME